MNWASIPAERFDELKQCISRKHCLLLCSKTNGEQIAALTALLDEFSHEEGMRLLREPRNDRYVLRDGKEV